MAPFIVDASVAAGWFIPDEKSPFADTVLRRLEVTGAVVPDLFWHEIRNLLLSAFRRKRIEQAEIRLSMIRLRDFKIVTAADQPDNEILQLAETYGLTAYDAAYLALALERKLSIATLDRRLAAAAQQAGCAMVGEV